MIKKLMLAIYALPFGVTVLLLLGVTFLLIPTLQWYDSADRSRKRLYRLLASAAFLLWLAAVLHSTVFSRSSGTLVVYRDLFHQLKEYPSHTTDRELFRMLWMNVLLFIPGGLLPETLRPRRFPRFLFLVLAVGLLTAVSVGIETAQYRYALGYVEADDVLCNGLGALLGAVMCEFARIQAEKPGRQMICLPGFMHRSQNNRRER